MPSGQPRGQSSTSVRVMDHSTTTTTTATASSRPSSGLAGNTMPRISTSSTGRVSIENMGTGAGSSEITIKSDFGGLMAGPAISSSASQHMTATRMSSGYFSGDEFRSYYANSATNYYDFGLANSQSPTLSSSTTMDTPGGVGAGHSSSSCVSTSNQFNPSRFLSNSSKARLRNSDEAIEDLNRMYKSIGLAEEEEANNIFGQQQQQQRFSSSSSFSNPPSSSADRFFFLHSNPSFTVSFFSICFIFVLEEVLF